MRNEGKVRRIINIRTPVVLYEKSNNEEPGSSTCLTSKFRNLFCQTKGVVSLKQRTPVKCNGRTKSSECMVRLRTKTQFSERKCAILKPNNIRLESGKSSDSKMSTYHQVLHKIASRFSLYKRTLNQSNSPVRKDSLETWEQLFSPCMSKSREASPIKLTYVYPAKKRMQSMFSGKSL